MFIRSKKYSFAPPLTKRALNSAIYAHSHGFATAHEHKRGLIALFIRCVRSQKNSVHCATLRGFAPRRRTFTGFFAPSLYARSYIFSLLHTAKTAAYIGCFFCFILLGNKKGWCYNTYVYLCSKTFASIFICMYILFGRLAEFGGTVEPLWNFHGEPNTNSLFIGL